MHGFSPIKASRRTIDETPPYVFTKRKSGLFVPERGPIDGPIDDGKAPSPLLVNLAAYWKLNEASGARYDSHTNGLTLTDTNTVTSAAGLIGNCGVFTETNAEYLALSGGSAGPIGGGNKSFSMCAWMKPASSSGYAPVISKGNLGNYNTTEYSLERDHIDNYMEFFVGNTAGSASFTVKDTSIAVTNSSNWYFVYAEHNNTTEQIGVSTNNNTLVQAAASSAGYASALAFVIGTWAQIAGEYWNGSIDEVGFWSRVLTTAERTFLYNGGNGRTYPF